MICVGYSLVPLIGTCVKDLTFDLISIVLPFILLDSNYNWIFISRQQLLDWDRRLSLLLRTETYSSRSIQIAIWDFNIFVRFYINWSSVKDCSSRCNWNRTRRIHGWLSQFRRWRWTRGEGHRRSENFRLSGRRGLGCSSGSWSHRCGCFSTSTNWSLHLDLWTKICWGRGQGLCVPKEPSPRTSASWTSQRPHMVRW
jgi:hypothetical protein